MRIISGRHRGRRLFVPKGQTIRPTADRVKEAIFNVLGNLVEGARVLDLFAGAGTLGLEALSRGASLAVFADHHRPALEAVKRNLETLGITDQQVIKVDLARGLGPIKDLEPFDLIFIDPPYRQDLAAKTLEHLSRHGPAGPDTLVVIEHSSKEDPAKEQTAWTLEQHRIYGSTTVSFLTLKKDAKHP